MYWHHEVIMHWTAALLFLLTLIKSATAYCDINVLLSECECTHTIINCTNTNLHDALHLRVIATRHDTLETVIFRGNNFTTLGQNAFGERDFPKLRHMDLSYNNIHTIAGQAFHRVSNLETLILSHNNWTLSANERVFTGLRSLKTLTLHNTFHEMVNGTFHIGELTKILLHIGVTEDTGLASLTELNLAGNEIWHFPAESQRMLCNLPLLTVFNISENRLTTPLLPPCLENLEVIDLSNNWIPYLSNQFIDHLTTIYHLKALYITNNMFECDCNMLDFHAWLLSTHVPIVDKDKLECYIGYKTSYEGVPLVEISQDELICEPGANSAMTAAYIVIGLIFSGMAVAVVVCLYLHRAKLNKIRRRIASSKLSLITRSHDGYATVTEQL